MTPDIKPLNIPLKREIKNICPVPIDNILFVNDGKYFNLVNVEKGEADYKKLINVKKLTEYHSFLPFRFGYLAFFNDSEFNLFNLHSRINIQTYDVKKPNLSLKKIFYIKNHMPTFLFVFRRTNFFSDDLLLELIQFSVKEKKEKSTSLGNVSFKKKYKGILTVHDDRIFKEDEGFFSVYDVHTLKVSDHPLCFLLNDLRKRRIFFDRIADLLIHPSLPFAYIREYRGILDYVGKLWLIQWKHPEYDKQIVEVKQKRFSKFSGLKRYCIKDMKFSPDGKWIVYSDLSKNLNKSYNMAIPVDMTKEELIGEPVLLGAAGKDLDISYNTWILNPLSYVITQEKNLSIWNL